MNNLEKPFRVLSVLRNRNVHRVMSILDEGEVMSVTEIIEKYEAIHKTHLDQTYSSYVLSKLRSYHLVNVSVSGKCRLYSLNKHKLASIQSLVDALDSVLNTSINPQGKVEEI